MPEDENSKRTINWRNAIVECKENGDVFFFDENGVSFDLKGHHLNDENCQCAFLRQGLVSYKSRSKECKNNGHCASVTHVYIFEHEKSTRILTTGNDGSVLLWTLNFQRENIVSEFKVLVTTTLRHPDFVGVGMIGKEYKRLFAVNRSGSLLLWDMNGQRLDGNGLTELPSPLSRWKPAPPEFYAGNFPNIELAKGLEDGRLLVHCEENKELKELYFDLK